ncbi:surface lipoprotein assembly modifier [Algirhabdus cladophorae]|uniref:surface lipoprotein assembly modifier n=1 Tax=Algirhabdus cladophorae TaxID=3377108 RepID=UPI003B848321
MKLAPFAFCCALALSFSGAATAQSGFSLPEARAIAQQLLVSGQPRIAIGMARALLDADPKDVQALILLSRAHKALGQSERSAQYGRRAYNAANAKNARFVAAMSVAEARATQGRLTASQVWLRRAEQNAPNDQVRNRVVRDFRFVRHNNPWRVDLRFDLRPSDNVNNGTTSKGMTFTLFGQDFFFETPVSALPLSGTEISYGTTLSYRPKGLENRPLAFTLDFDGREIRLSSEARDLNPDAKNSDFTFHQLSFGAKYDLVNTPTSSVSAGLSIGRNWYASEHLSEIFRANISGGTAINSTQIIGGGLDYDRRERQDAAERSSTTWTLRGYHSTNFENAGRLTFNLSTAKANAISADYAYRSATFGARYALDKAVLGAKMDFSISYTAKNFDRPLYSSDPRKDITTRVGTSLFFENASYLGFAPVVSFSASRTDSNVARFDTEEIGISIGMRSTF